MMEEKFQYQLKNSLITQSECAYFDAIKKDLPDGFSVFPQINLATFIEKTDGSRFHNELFRNVDFLITNDKYQPMIIIEINDRSHNTTERKERDEKVKNICEEAGIPIIKLWTSYGVNDEYIKNKIAEVLNSLPVVRIHHFNNTNNTNKNNRKVQKEDDEETAGCYVATCVYGSYDCPQVWVLRRYRDIVLSNHLLGKLFIKIYYCISPKLVKIFGKQSWFRKICKSLLDPMVNRLHKKGFEDTPYYD